MSADSDEEEAPSKGGKGSGGGYTLPKPIFNPHVTLPRPWSLNPTPGTRNPETQTLNPGPGTGGGKKKGYKSLDKTEEFYAGLS